MNSTYMQYGLIALLALLGVMLALPIIPFSASQENSPSNESYVNVTVNITNSAPIVTSIILDASMDLAVYSTAEVMCNASVYDWDNNLALVNATLYRQPIANSSSPDDFNWHYSNASCTNSTGIGVQMNYSCSFWLQYWADNATTWYCNVTAFDIEGANSSNTSIAGTVNPLVGLYIPGFLDYGNLKAGETSGDRLANVTNAGNRPINLLVEGYSNNRGDSIALNCTYGNIAHQWERYNITPGLAWDTQMFQITNAPVLIPGLEVLRRIDDAEESRNSTFWKLQIPNGAGGNCTGKLMFQAIDSGS